MVTGVVVVAALYRRLILKNERANVSERVNKTNTAVKEDSHARQIEAAKIREKHSRTRPVTADGVRIANDRFDRAQRKNRNSGS